MPGLILLELAALPEVASHVTSGVAEFTLHPAPLQALFIRSRAKLFFLTRLGPLRAIMFSTQCKSLFFLALRLPLHALTASSIHRFKHFRFHSSAELDASLVQV